LGYVYDAAGNLATFTDNLNPVSFTDSSTSNTYNYDSTYRLASVAGTAPARFTYNYAGDVGTKTANGSTYTYQYDAFRNLTGISQSSGGNLATFSYDGDGKRISKLAGGVLTIYHYDKEGRLLSESDANGNPICDYIYLGTNLVGKMYEPASSGIYYFHTDPAGTPLAVTDSSGMVVWRGYYEAFGNEYAIQGTIGNDVRFAGNKKDAETGLNYFTARYMDTTSGRFMAPDPIGPVDSKTGKINNKMLTEPQRLNAYAYALNGPGRYVDRGGKNPLLIVAVAAYLLLHNSDVANAPAGPTDPTYASSGAGDIAGDGALILGGIQAIDQAATPPPPPPSTPVGRLGTPMEVAPGTNACENIGDRTYTGHALDQMQGRGIPPSVVEDTIATGSQTPGYDGATIYTTDQARVIVNPNGSVKTVMPQ
jgi:RHS repeat-associated protein